MIRCAVITCAAFLLGCSSAMPPAGPKHTPSNSSESETACPEERSKAQTAREALLGEDLSGAGGTSLTSAAAQAVFAHAECEAEALAKQSAPVGKHDQVLSSLRSTRLQMADAASLFDEVSRYDSAALALRAGVSAARLKIAFAALVRSVQTPASLDEQGRMAFKSELEEAAQILRREARSLLSQSLEDSERSSETRALKPEICELLEGLEWQGAGC